MTRYWIGVASRDHVKVGEAGGFCQLGHGKAAPVQRLSPGDWLIYYSPRERMKAGAPLQSFTAIGQIRVGDAYRVQQNAGFCPVRRDIAYVRADDAPIAPLLDDLDFASGRANWGLLMRRGSFEISARDHQTIATAMRAAVSTGAI